MYWNPNFSQISVEHSCKMIDMIDEKSLQELQNLIQVVVEAQTDNLSEIVKIAGLDPAEDFAGADMRSTRLRGAILRGADLSGTDLSGANIKGALLSEANLSEANLSDANLSGANLLRADLSD